MKQIKRIISITLLMITILGIIAFPTTSHAMGERTEIKGLYRYGNLLERNGVDLTCIRLDHGLSPSGTVYCLELDLDGATEDFSYPVTVNGLVTDIEVWRTIINGYPFKTLDELGCTENEAYLATRQAIYCALYGRDPNSYHALGETDENGENATLRALKKIVSAARSSTEVKASSSINIEEVDYEWSVDEENKNYISKRFKGTAEAPIGEYTVELSGNLVDGIKIKNNEGVETNKFTDNEIFKIMIPLKNIKQDGKLYIDAEGKVATKPVYLGTPDNSNLQPVAITKGLYEDGRGRRIEHIFKNRARIVIQKQDQETEKPLEGVKFQLLDENKNVIYTDLVTDKEGTIIIENLVPGRYYIKEVEALAGYYIYPEPIDIDVGLNEEVGITMNNLVDKREPEIHKTTTKLEVEQKEEQAEPTQKEVNYIKIEEKIESKVEEKTEIKKEEKRTINLPKTGM